MIKVEHTKTHLVANDDILDFSNVLVTDAELVLVPDKPARSVFGSLAPNDFILSNPIFISRIEKIEVGDWFITSHNDIVKCTSIRDSKDNLFFYLKDNFEYCESRTRCNKILALPEHFSPTTLQMIVGGKLKEGKYLIECENQKLLVLADGIGGFNDHKWVNNLREGQAFREQREVIKLNPHITIYPVESKQISVQKIKYLAKDLIDDGFNTEYTRGICELLANIDGVEDVDCAERALQIAKELGVSDKNSEKMYAIYPVEEKMYNRLEIMGLFKNYKEHFNLSDIDTEKEFLWFEQNIK